jgi:hypothetical protein
VPVLFEVRNESFEEGKDMQQLLILTATLLVLGCGGQKADVERSGEKNTDEDAQTQAPARSDDPGSDLTVVGRQGQVDFVLASEKISNEPEELEQALRTLCGSTRGNWCQLMVWSNKSFVPRGLPMSDASLNHQVAQYNKNTATGYDCFYLMQKGEMVESSRSQGCS